MSDREFDRRLSGLVRERRAEPSVELQERLRGRLREERPQRSRAQRRQLAWRPAFGAVAALLVLALGAFLLLRDAPPAAPGRPATPPPAGGNRFLPAPAALPAAVLQARPASLPARRVTHPARPAAAPSEPPGEIRTELEIPGKEIRIIWVQRPDFDLRRINP